YFHRGLTYLRQRDYPQAMQDFTKTLDLEPDNADAHINRALALHGLKRLPEAIEDLDKALDLNTRVTRIYFMRARFRDMAGDVAGAQKYREEGLKREPVDEQSWIARGVAKLGQDPAGALADFEKALEMNPQSLAALVNSAHVLGERLGKQEEALEALDRALAS